MVPAPRLSYCQLTESDFKQETLQGLRKDAMAVGILF